MYENILERKKKHKYFKLLFTSIVQLSIQMCIFFQRKNIFLLSDYVIFVQKLSSFLVTCDIPITI